SSYRGPDVRAVTRVPTFGRDEQPGVGVQRLADQILADERAVRIGRVEQIDAEVARTTKRCDRAFAVDGRPPDSWTGDPHRAEPESVNTALPENLKPTRCFDTHCSQPCIARAPPSSAIS